MKVKSYKVGPTQAMPLIPTHLPLPQHKRDTTLSTLKLKLKRRKEAAKKAKAPTTPVTRSIAQALAKFARNIPSDKEYNRWLVGK